MSAILISVRQVTKLYGPVRALAGVTESFREGEVVAIIGPNGSGKSTLLSILATLARPTSGAVDHVALGSSRAAVRAGLGWLGHDSMCYGELTGRENLELAAALCGVDGAAAYARLQVRFGLASFAERPVRTYSRGQKQRIALARALVHRPRLLLLDEPTTGLDAEAMERLVAVVREEASAGTGVVVVTHDPQFAGAIGARVVRMERGRLAHGSP